MFTMENCMHHHLGMLRILDYEIIALVQTFLYAPLKNMSERWYSVESANDENEKQNNQYDFIWLEHELNL